MTLSVYVALQLASLRARPSGISLYVDRQPTVEERKANFTNALFEPDFGCFLGAYIDQDETILRTYRDEVGRVHRFPEDFESKVQKRHGSYFFYMGYGMPLAKDWIRKVEMDRFVHIALEPNLGLEPVFEDKYLIKLAKDLRDTGRKIFLRFASEMNGDWVAYGLDSSMYCAAFDRVAAIMHKIAPNVAMVWCPYASPTRNIMDYYPGDDAVDWVGVNMYCVTYFNQDLATPGWQVHPADMINYIYDRFSQRKPIMVAEFGATHYSAVEKQDRTAFARRMIKQFYQALPRLYPRVKCINYFNANNLQIEHARNNDYSVTNSLDILNDYSAVIQSPYFLSTTEETSSGDVPMPMRLNEILRSNQIISAFMKTTVDLTLSFSVNGRLLKKSSVPGDSSYTLDFSGCQPGPATLSVSAWEGQILKSQSNWPIIIQK